MQLLVTASAMQRFDQLAIDRYRVPGIVLMENAGRAFADQVEATFGSVSQKEVVILCGKGNNGGDGFVIARHLANRRAHVTVIALAKTSEIKGDARTNLDAVLRMARDQEGSLTFKQVSSAKGFPRLRKPDLIIDAIFGTGFSGAVRGIAEKAIRWVNGQTCHVVSVDIPSGVDATTGVVQNLAVKADLTVTMGLAKIGQFVGQGREHCGNVVVADISIPRLLFRPDRRQVYRVQLEDVLALLPRRPLTAHKHSVGKIFVLAGSRNLTGAPTMAAQAAMKSGAGAVVLGTPRSIYNTLIRKLTEVMVTPLDETAAGSVSFEAVEEIKKQIRWADVVVIGPGLSTHPETQNLVLSLLPEIPKPLVVDADGLNALATDPTILRKRKYPTVLTPHVGELSRLTKDNPDDIETFRVAFASRAADRLRCTVALKGSPTVTGTPGGPCYMNSTGNPGMATAGAGDVLTGIIAALAGQGLPMAEAAYCGAFIHGLAGDLASDAYGQRSVMALDILNHIPKALKMVEK